MQIHIKIASTLANLLDNSLQVGGLRFGFSAIFDLIPGIGDFLDATLSLYIVWIGIQMKLPGIRITQMLGNILLSFLIGFIPVVGDVAYIFLKANLRNLEILKKYATFVEGEVI